MITYLDHAATTFPKPEIVYRAMDDANRNFCVNAGRGSYALAQKAAALIQDTKRKIIHITDAAESAEVVFTASATLAFNIVIGGMDWKQGDVVYVTPYEHNAVMRTLYGYQRKCGFQIKELPLTVDNLAVDMEKTAYFFAKQPPDYLFVNLVSNVTGYILPTEQLCRMAAAYKCVTVLDGAQALGSIPVSLRELEADFLVFAGHKSLCGPLGAGGYVNEKRRYLKHVLFGGTGSDSLNPAMPDSNEGYEPGSPNITAIAGLHAALDEIGTPESRQKLWREEQRKTAYLLTELRKIPGMVVYGASDENKQAGIVSVNLEGYTAQELGMLLDEDYDIAVRTGYHCAPLIHKYLHNKEYLGTLRISIGRTTGYEDLDRIVKALRELAQG